MTTHPVAAYRIRTTNGSAICLVAELRDRPRIEFPPLTIEDARVLNRRLGELIEADDIECNGGVPPTIFPGENR